MKVPPFRVGNFVAVAYVAGRYSPAGRRLGPAGFLGLYLSLIEEARFSFWTFKTDGHNIAFRDVCSKNGNFDLEYALIHGAICYAVPFDQWRPYPISPAERRILRRLRLEKEYEKTRYALAHVLYLARGSLYFSLDKFAIKLGQNPKHVLKPMFEVRPRSADTIRRDRKERDQIFGQIEMKMWPQKHKRNRDR